MGGGPLRKFYLYFLTFKRSIMKLNFLLQIVVGILILQSCVAQKQPLYIENAIGEKIYTKFSGTCLWRRTDDKSYLLLVNTTKSTDSYDRAIIVFSDHSVGKPEINEEATYEFFIPENKRFIVVHNQNTNKVFILGLSDQSAKQKIEKFKSNASMRSALTNKDYLGYGLSYMTGLWNRQKIKESKYKLPFNTLDYANTLNPEAAASLGEPEDELGGAGLCDIGQCSSGGAGSSSCSVMEIGGMTSCTVTCNTGYYACCNSSTTGCYCCRIQ